MTEEQNTQQEELTEVTSVAKEEAKTGTKVALPTAEEMNAKAAASFIRNTTELQYYLSTIKSNKRLIRTFMAILDLPKEGQSIRSFTDAERAAFVKGQSAINDRFIMTQYHITQERKIHEELDKLRKVQVEAIEKLKSEGASEEEIKTLQAAHKESIIELNKTLRGEIEEKGV